MAQDDVPPGAADVGKCLVDEVRALLAARAGSSPVSLVETHGARVVLAGDEAWKIKRPVRFPYMDFSTLALRRAALAREFEINRPFAPEIYVGLVPVTRERDGTLALDGSGEVVEWALRMRRFPETDVLSRVATRGTLDRALAARLAEVVAAAHARMPEVHGAMSGGQRFGQTLRQIAAGLAEESELLGGEAVARFGAAATGRHAAVALLLDRRADAGLVRRCHGDLHLGNIVLWNGGPTLFDAIEFSDEIATIDVLYDLAFLVMDLDVRGMGAEANRLLNRYLEITRRPLDIAGLAALPLFLACRAAVRAMVGAERAAQEAGEARDRDTRAARGYLASALRFLSPVEPALVAIGGFSGTGKTTLAAELAPWIGGAPGAIHIRTDIERKALAGVAETERLPASSYTAAASRGVYAAALARTEGVLAARHSAVVDAVFSKDDERRAIEHLARRQGAGFLGIWLDAGREALVARVAGRKGDASDATPAVVESQIAAGAGAVGWVRVDAGGTPDATLAAARRVIAGTSRAVASSGETD